MKAQEPNITNIKAWMRAEIFAHPAMYIDCGEVNMTGLAEAACMEFDAYGPEPRFDIPEMIWDAAFEVAEEYDDGITREDAERDDAIMIRDAELGAYDEHPEFPHGEFPDRAEVSTMTEPPTRWADDSEPDYNPN